MQALWSNSLLSSLHGNYLTRIHIAFRSLNPSHPASPVHLSSL